MSTHHNDGGPAYPIQHSEAPGAFMAQRGMSLRDFFAAHALTGIVSEGLLSPTAAAADAYGYADAMLRAREAK